MCVRACVVCVCVCERERERERGGRGGDTLRSMILNAHSTGNLHQGTSFMKSQERF